MRAHSPLLMILWGAGGGAGCGVNNPTYFTPPMGAGSRRESTNSDWLCCCFR